MALAKLPEADLEASEDSIFADINITPLTDVILVLLIIFMVASSAAAEQQVREAVADQSSGLEMNLPSGAAHDIDPTKPSLVVAIPLSGDIAVNETTVKEKDLDNLFRSAFARNKETQVVIRADRGVNHGRVVTVMERARKAGLTSFGIATE
ncbi:MAG TPA: biopolymer transporter ExbD [Kofleriaceae bacterium]|nr:biopolymer transporter ExbD [Kofleriaceae bacterium]